MNLEDKFKSIVSEKYLENKFPIETISFITKLEKNEYNVYVYMTLQGLVFVQYFQDIDHVNIFTVTEKNKHERLHRVSVR